MNLLISQGLYCGCEDGSVLVVDCTLVMGSAKDPAVHISTVLPPSENIVTALCINTSQLVVGYDNGFVKSLDLQNCNVMWELAVATIHIRSLEFGGSSCEDILVSTDSSLQTITVYLCSSGGLKRPSFRIQINLCSDPIAGSVAVELQITEVYML